MPLESLPKIPKKLVTEPDRYVVFFLQHRIVITSAMVNQLHTQLMSHSLDIAFHKHIISTSVTEQNVIYTHPVNVRRISDCPKMLKNITD